MKKILIVLLFFSMFVFSACQYDEDAKIVVTEKISGRTNEGKYFTKITLKNTGGQPAFMVVVMGSAQKNGKEIDYKERAYGDIYEGKSVSDTLFFENIFFEEPDSINISITYTPYNLLN